MSDELTTLLLEAAAGNRAALERFVQRTQVDVWRFCAHLVDPAAADDLTQEVYLRALGSLPRFRGEATARTWLLAVARNVAADEIRRRTRRRERFGAPSLPDDDVLVDAAADETDAVEMSQLAARLDPDRRAAFVLTQLLGLSYADAAAACAVPVGTIRSRVARARADLVAMLPARDRGSHSATGDG